MAAALAIGAATVWMGTASWLEVQYVPQDNIPTRTGGHAMETRVRCKHCAGWIPSPVRFGAIETFDATALHGNKLQCPSCGERTPCDKANMRVGYVREGEEGGFLGIETLA